MTPSIWIANIEKEKAAHFRKFADWADTFIGPPRHTPRCATERYAELGIVGVYRSSDRRKSQLKKEGRA